MKNILCVKVSSPAGTLTKERGWVIKVEALDSWRTWQTIGLTFAAKAKKRKSNLPKTKSGYQSNHWRIAVTCDHFR